MTRQPPVTAEDLYLYALQLLVPEEQTRLQEFLQHSPEARKELANVRGDLILLSLTPEQHTPPALCRQRLLKQVARGKKSAVHSVADRATAQHAIATEPIFAPEPAPDRLSPIRDDSYTPSPETSFPFRSFQAEEPQRGLLATLLPWVGWALAVGLAVSTWTMWHKAEILQGTTAAANAKAAHIASESDKSLRALDVLRNSAAQRFQLTKQSSQPISNARVTYVSETGSLIFQGANLDQLPAGKVYELWLIPVGDGRTPIPAGTFRPDERGYASVVLPDIPKGVVAGTFGVTMEEEGGANNPTLPILMIGA
ncbi:anti-sigma factor domain-containing protein [Terriglobus sp. RCC_193]|uniref:anti-sigma factor domain-containing protein n=1 Tax=Terriglobus sp. RCC_193 TaxID=3239218 RepID=UPI003525EFA1